MAHHQNRSIHRSSWSRGVKAVTLCVLSLDAVVLIAGALMLKSDRAIALLFLLPGIALALALLSLFITAPRKYLVDASSIMILGPAMNISIPLKRVEGIELIGYDNTFREATGGGTRGGIFGYVGHYYGKLREFRAYCTRQDNLVLVNIADRPGWVLSPDSPEEFVASVKQRLRTAEI